MVIYLGPVSPPASSSLPGADGPPFAPCSALLRMGFTYAPSVTTRAVVSYTAFPPLHTLVCGLFLLHCPWSRLRQTLSGILPCEARTFLSRSLSALRQRPSVLLEWQYFITNSVFCPEEVRKITILFSIHTTFQKGYTLKQLPPINSLIREFSGITLLSIPRK